MFGQQWGLESVEVTHMNTGTRQFFHYDDWVTGDKRRVQLVPGKAGGSNVYKVGRARGGTGAWRKAKRCTQA